jgi:hypothetical protein
MLDLYAAQDSDHSNESIQLFICQNCKFPLALHQPDPQLPDRLLATCDECKSWYVRESAGAKLLPIVLAGCG